MILWAIVIVGCFIFRHQFAYFAGGYIIYPLVRCYCSIKTGVVLEKRHRGDHDDEDPAIFWSQLKDESSPLRKEAEVIYADLFDKWCDKHLK